MPERKETTVSWTPIEVSQNREGKSRPRINIEWQKGIETSERVEATAKNSYRMPSSTSRVFMVMGTQLHHNSLLR